MVNMNDMMNKRSFTIVSGIILLMLLNTPNSYAEYGLGEKSKKALVKSFPDSLGCIVLPFYRHRPDGKPGREITLNFKGPKFSGKGTLELECSGEKEIIQLNENVGIDHYSILLPPGTGVKSECEEKITLRSPGHEISSSFTVPEKRNGSKIETLVQVDVPGMSWGVVPGASKLRIKYCFAMNNGSDLVGLSTDLSFK